MDLDIIRKFLDVYHVDLANTEGIHLAAGCGHLDVVKLLIEEYGADIEQRDLDEMPPLLNAAENAHTEIVTYLLERGADIEAADSHGAGLVHVAAQSLNVEFIRTLVEEHDLDASATDNKGTTAVHYSAMNGDIPMVRFLVEELNVPFVREARTEAPETQGGSLLMTVAATEYTEMFRWLVDNYGLDPMSKDWKQCSLLFDAARSGKDCMVDFLIREYGLDPTEVDDEGCLPTFDAASQGHFHTIQNLVDNHGVDPHHVDSFGQSILFVAAAMGDEQLFDLIGAFAISISISISISSSPSSLTLCARSFQSIRTTWTWRHPTRTAWRPSTTSRSSSPTRWVPPRGGLISGSKRTWKVQQTKNLTTWTTTATTAARTRRTLRPTTSPGASLCSLA